MGVAALLAIGLVGAAYLAFSQSHPVDHGANGKPQAASQQSAGGLPAQAARQWQQPQAPPHLPIEVYARGINTDASATAGVAALLSDEEKKELRALCGRTLYHSYATGWVTHETGLWTFVATGAACMVLPLLLYDARPHMIGTATCVLPFLNTNPSRSWAAGDLPLMWIRDSAVQINVLLPRIRKRPALRRPIEGAIRAQAFYILQVWCGDCSGMLQRSGMGRWQPAPQADHSCTCIAAPLTRLAALLLLFLLCSGSICQRI